MSPDAKRWFHMTLLFRHGTHPDSGCKDAAGSASMTARQITAVYPHPKIDMHRTRLALQATRLPTIMLCFPHLQQLQHPQTNTHSISTHKTQSSCHACWTFQIAPSPHPNPHHPIHQNPVATGLLTVGFIPSCQHQSKHIQLPAYGWVRRITCIRTQPSRYTEPLKGFCIANQARKPYMRTIRL